MSERERERERERVTKAKLVKEFFLKEIEKKKKIDLRQM